MLLNSYKTIEDIPPLQSMCLQHLKKQTCEMQALYCFVMITSDLMLFFFCSSVDLGIDLYVKIEKYVYVAIVMYAAGIKLWLKYNITW